MKIRDYVDRSRRRLAKEPYKYEIASLMHGYSHDAITLNNIMKYLGFEDEDKICSVPCDKCPYDRRKSDWACDIPSSDHVRDLIRRKNNPLEDML